MIRITDRTLKDTLKILVATWGNPFTWRKAIYKLNGRSRSAMTTLAPLMDELQPDRVMLYVPETLLCMKGPSLDNLREYTRKPVLLEDAIPEAPEGSPSCYGELLLNLSEAVKEFLRRETDGDESILRLMVMPNIGSYACSNLRASWILPRGRGMSADHVYSAYVLSSLLAAMDELMRREYQREVHLILDTTHGMNYMPLAAYEATLTAARIISAGYGVDVVFLQYNSAPYPPGISEPELEIYLVREERITPAKAAQRLVYTYLAGGDLSKPVIFSEVPESMESRASEIRRWMGRLKRVHSMAGPLVSSIHYSLPLAFLQFSHDSSESDALEQADPSSVHEKLEEVLLMVDEQWNREEVTIRHVAAPDYRKLRSYHAARSLILYGQRALSEFDVETREGMVSADLDTLRAVTEEYLRGPLQMVTEQELSRLHTLPCEGRPEEMSLAVESGVWVPLGKSDCIEHLRNFIAHSGLALNFLECKQEDGRLLFRYRKKCRNEIRKLAFRALKKIGEFIATGSASNT